MSKRPHIPISLAIPAVIDGAFLYNVAKDGVSTSEMGNLAFMYTGWNGNSLDFSRLAQTYGKYVGGAVVHYAAQKTGVNRKISKFTRGYVVI
jgi:hypothetical protein